ncbi:L,D-transpeptidase family protein [Sphingosinicella terrae]|uniref:L,D-transpeptidase family protein n=1 Tax=Sphingosinicella terrae TaxID=2172047 RepID=UPI0025474C40|nr:L,D-transpeptidase family protein [Sphingosinicella terrae]
MSRTSAARLTAGFIRVLLAGGSLGLLLHTATLVSAQGSPAATAPAATALAMRPAAPAAAPALAPAPVVAAPAVAAAAVVPAVSATGDGSLLGGRAPTAAAILEAVQLRRELDVPHWLRPGEYVWTDQPIPQEGPTVIVANIRGRVISVYRGGVEIGRSSLLYGANEKPTPLGEFPILEKDADHVSNLYDAPMPHMMRLTWDGVALHGSPELRDDLATRGCIGLPREFAALLFGVARVGDRVIVWDGETRA